MDNDQIVFGKKKYSDILKEIYERSNKKEEQISGLIVQLKGLIMNTADAYQLVPMIASYIKISVDNDGNLIKMAQIVTKAVDRGKETGDFNISDDEREQLLSLAQESVAIKSIDNNKNLPKA